MTKQEFLKVGRTSGIPVAVVRYAVANQMVGYPILQELAQHSADMRSSCGPRPKPKFEPGYWECSGGEWVWISGV